MRIGRVATPDESEGFQLNDLWLIDEKPYQVSRTHCAIELGPRGNVVVSDRGSNLGMLVNDTPVGGRAAARTAVLHPGQNVLVLGTRMSPYQFRVTVDDA
jgi:pSer/pThr/pTyr-binding forkhead associated (FHA) protein